MKRQIATPTNQTSCLSLRRASALALVLAATLLSALLTACSSSSTPTAAIASFAATKSAITNGASTTLIWAVSNASSVTINGTTETGYSLTVSPTSTTTYTLVATNAAGTSATASVTVTVDSAASISGFAPTSSIITYGGSTALNWTASNASSLSINGTAVTGSTHTVSPTTTTIYTLTATNAAGDSVTAETTVYVLPAIANFASSSASVSSGGSGATLSWTTHDADTLVLTITPASGSAATVTVTGDTSYVVSPSVTTAYQLTATNTAGSTTSSTVTIATTAQLSDITGFLAYKTSTATAGAVASTNGGTVYLIPTFASNGTDADTATITDTAGASYCEGSVASGTACAVTPSETTTYTLTVTNPNTSPAGTETRNLRVIVGDVTVFSGISSAQGYYPTFSDGDATAAQFNWPTYITADTSGNFYFTDAYECAIEKLDTNGAATRIAGNLSTYTYQNLGYTGNLCGTSHVDGDATTTALFSDLYGIAADSTGNVYVGEYTNSDIRKVQNGTVSTPAGSYTSKSADKDGQGAAATFSMASGIMGVALDSLGELIVAEGGAIRVMDVNGYVTTLAGASPTYATSFTDGVGKTGSGTNTVRFSFVESIAIDASTDTIYIADDAGIRVMTPDKSNAATYCPGITYPGAACWDWRVKSWINPSDTYGYKDGSASAAQFNYGITAIARANDGTLFVADYYNGYIRRVTPEGVVDTIAGNGTTSCGTFAACTLPNSTSGTTTKALPGVIYEPYGIAVDSTQKRLIFDVMDVNGIYTMPY